MSNDDAAGVASLAQTGRAGPDQHLRAAGSGRGTGTHETVVAVRLAESVPTGQEWTRMSHHVRMYLAAHPAMRGFQVVTRASAGGLTAELLYAGQTLRADLTKDGWWDPCTPARGHEIADRLARDLYAQWLALLRRT